MWSLRCIPTCNGTETEVNTWSTHKMTKDKINVLLPDWIETQQSRLANMAKYNVRVCFVKDNLKEDFYATLEITKTYIYIWPWDARKDVLCLDEARLKKFDECGAKGIVLYRKYSKLKWKVYFQKTKIRDAAIKKLRTLTGDDSTDSTGSESTGSDSTAVSSAV